LSGQLERCLAAGMDGLLTKPIEIDKLRETVATYCQKLHIPSALHAMDGTTTSVLLESPMQPDENHLDIEQLRITAGNDAGFMHELTQLYLHSSRQIVDDMHTALAQGDRTDLCRHAHKLKGASAGIHARYITGLCEALEKNAPGLASEELTKLLVRLEQALASLRKELQRIISQDQSAA
jgi:HPt (histidine-containing phosphotransfer) domain-containing protein